MIRAKGSLSVFFALIMVAVMTLLFTMSECIRIYELHELAQEYTDMAVESAFSEYNPYLWSNYKILAIDLGYGTDSTGPGIMEQKTLDFRKCVHMIFFQNLLRLLFLNHILPHQKIH